MTQKAVTVSRKTGGNLFSFIFYCTLALFYLKRRRLLFKNLSLAKIIEQKETKEAIKLFFPAVALSRDEIKRNKGNYI